MLPDSTLAIARSNVCAASRCSRDNRTVSFDIRLQTKLPKFGAIYEYNYKAALAYCGCVKCERHKSRQLKTTTRSKVKAIHTKHTHDVTRDTMGRIVTRTSGRAQEPQGHRDVWRVAPQPPGRSQPHSSGRIKVRLESWKLSEKRFNLWKLHLERMRRSCCRGIWLPACEDSMVLKE